MSEYKKPIVKISDVAIVLDEYFTGVTGITLLEGGNFSNAFSFSVLDQEYVIKFSDLAESYETERFISTLLLSEGIPFPRCIELGKFNSLNYLISEKIRGKSMNRFSLEKQQAVIPELIQILTRMNQVNIGSTKGYGIINANGNGSYDSWKEHIIASYAEEQQPGSFFEGWYTLFETSCLERDVFDELYNRLLAYSVYNEPYRHFIHGDFHQFNIMSDGSRITGIIDSNGKYGDFFIDLATLDWHLKVYRIEQDVAVKYERYQEELGIVIPHFKERLIGAKYYNGLIGLRFFARMGWDQSYIELRDELLKI